MIHLFMLCTAELAALSVEADMSHVQEEHKNIPAKTLWVEQCVMKKAVW